MIVRLKDAYVRDNCAKKTGFNSMIVRLKEKKKMDAIKITMFQFYDSPIKRGRDVFLANMAIVFQFYDSPIKRTPSLSCPPLPHGVSIL